MALDPVARRRWLGVAFLLGAIAMLVIGETPLTTHLSPKESLVFWLSCLALTFAAIIVALRDFRALRQSVRRDQRVLFESTLVKIEKDARSKRTNQNLPQQTGSGGNSS